MQKRLFFKKFAPFYIADSEELTYLLRLARASIHKHKHSSGTRFLAKGNLVVTRGTLEQTTPATRLLMRRAERRVRPNIQQTCPKTRGNIGLRIAARRLTKTLPRDSYRAEANAALAYRKKKFLWRVTRWVMGINGSNFTCTLPLKEDAHQADNGLGFVVNQRQSAARPEPTSTVCQL